MTATCAALTPASYAAEVRPRLAAMRAVILNSRPEALAAARQQAKALLAALPPPPADSRRCVIAADWANAALEDIITGRVEVARLRLAHALRCLPAGEAP